MVAGHLREKNGYYHMVLNYVDEYGKRHTPSKSTGLTVKGNKKRAEKMLSEARAEKEAELEASSTFSFGAVMVGTKAGGDADRLPMMVSTACKKDISLTLMR